EKGCTLCPFRQLGQRLPLQSRAWHGACRFQFGVQAGLGPDLAQTGPGSQRHELFHRGHLPPAGMRYRAGGSGDRASPPRHRHQQHEAGARREPPLPVRDLHRLAPASSEARHSDAASTMTLRIALFCGGRGSATIIRALLRRTDVELTLLVNGYDDGLSTGALRNFIPGMLGPSDFRKNLSYLFGNYSQAQYALKSLMEYRLAGAAEIEELARFT